MSDSNRRTHRLNATPRRVADVMAERMLSACGELSWRDPDLRTIAEAAARVVATVAHHRSRTTGTDAGEAIVEIGGRAARHLHTLKQSTGGRP